MVFALGYYSGDATAKNKVLAHATHFCSPLRGRQLLQQVTQTFESLTLRGCEQGAFGYMLGKFWIDGLCILWLLVNLKLLEL